MLNYNRNMQQCIFVLILILLLFFIFVQYNFSTNFGFLKYENTPSKFIMDRLKSHARYYNDSSSPCTLTGNVPVEQMEHLKECIEVLTKFREEIKPSYPERLFHGRGIVMSVGVRQISLTKVNLKMIERIKTSLPVQVELKITLIVYQTLINITYS